MANTVNMSFILIVLIPSWFNYRYLVGDQTQHTSLSGAVLDKDLSKMDNTVKENRRQLLLEHFVDGKARPDVKITTVYTTVEERVQGEDITSQSKAEILQRAEDKINLLIDGDAKDVLQSKLNELKRKQSSTRKEILISFFHEVCENINRMWTLRKLYFLKISMMREHGQSNEKLCQYQ